MEIMSDYGVVVPDSIKGQISVIKLVEFVEANPKVPFLFNHTDAEKLFEDVRAAVLSYYGLSYATESVNSAQYVLQDSTFYSWDSSMELYNCYGYAIGLKSPLDPGWLSGGSYDESKPIIETARLVQMV